MLKLPPWRGSGFWRGCQNFNCTKINNFKGTRSFLRASVRHGTILMQDLFLTYPRPGRWAQAHISPPAAEKSILAVAKILFKQLSQLMTGSAVSRISRWDVGRKVFSKQEEHRYPVPGKMESSVAFTYIFMRGIWTVSMGDTIRGSTERKYFGRGVQLQQLGLHCVVLLDGVTAVRKIWPRVAKVRFSN